MLGPAHPVQLADDLHCVAAAPDDAFVLAGSGYWSPDGFRPGNIHVLRLPDLEEVRAWQAHPLTVLALHVTRDGKRIVSGGMDGEVRLWTVEGRLLGRLVEPDPARSRARVADIVDAGGARREQLVVARTDASLTPVRLADDGLAIAAPATVLPVPDLRRVLALPDGRIAAATAADLLLVDLERGVNFPVPDVPPGTMDVVRRARDGLLACVAESAVAVVDLEQGRARTTPLAGRWRSIAWCGDRLVLGGFGPTRMATVDPDSLAVECAPQAVGGTNAWSAVSLSSGEVVIGEASRLRRLARGARGPAAPPADVPIAVESLATSGDGAWAVVGSHGTLHRYDLRGGRKEPGLRVSAFPVRGVGIGASGAPLFAACWGGPGNIVLLTSGEAATSLARVDAPYAPAVSGGALAPDARRVVTAGEDGQLDVWDVGDGALTHRADLGKDLRMGYIVDLSFTADGRHLVTASDARNGIATHLAVWDLEAKALVGAPIGRADRSFNAMALVQGGLELAVTGATTGDLEVWDLRLGQVRTRLRGHTHHVVDVAISPDGALVASVSLDGWLHVSRIDGSSLGSFDLGARGDRGTQVAFRGAPPTLLVGTARGDVLELEVRP